MKKLLFCLLLLVHLNNAYSQFGTWTVLRNSTNGNQGVMLLLTDGTVLCMSGYNPYPSAQDGSVWNKLTPDIHGSYINGTWSNTSPMNYDRDIFSSCVLPNGKVFVAGAEYSDYPQTATIAEEYDPTVDAWTTCGSLPNSSWAFIDPNSKLLNNGDVLTAPWDSPTIDYFNSILWAPSSFSNSTTTPYPGDENAGATWLKLPDNTVLYACPFSLNSCRYFPSSNTWVNDAVLPVSLFNVLGSTGPASMLPNGKAIFFGSVGRGDNGYTAIYTPSGSNSPGTWAQGPSFPIISDPVNPTLQSGANISNCAMMVNGKILIAVTTDDIYTYFLEYDYLSNSFSPPITSIIPSAIQAGGKNYIESDCQFIYMLDLPDGNVLVANAGNEYYMVYTPVGGPLNSWRPTINNITETGCGTYTISGKLFDGISEGASFGDWQMASNYPIIRLTQGTNVYYAKTTNWSPIAAVQTGSQICSTAFALPAGMSHGTYQLEVVANGIPSLPITFTYGPIVRATDVTGNACVGTQTRLIASASGSSGPYQYSWNPGGETTAIITPIAPNTNTIYTVTVTDGYGCTSSASVTLTVDPNCCHACAGGFSVPSGSNSTHYTSAQFTNNGCITITGPGAFTIPTGHSLTISNCNIAMGDGASIIVESGATLNIVNGSRLYACGDMWQGIQVKQGGNLNIQGFPGFWFFPPVPSIIEDAIKGVEIQGSSTRISIVQSTLNNNLYDIYMDPNSGTISGNIGLSNTLLTCQRDGGYSPNQYLKAPYSGYITNSGVYLDGIQGIIVGNYSSLGDMNTFNNMNYGVNANNSGFEVYNNTFENLAGNTGYCLQLKSGGCPPPIGIAVLANTTTPYVNGIYSMGYYQSIVGGTSANLGNIMKECYRGVDITGYSFPWVIDNTITNINDAYSTPHINPYPYGDHAIFLKELGWPTVDNNNITNYITGIHLIDFALAGFGSYFGDINNNNISASGTTTGVMNSGILAEVSLPLVANPEPLYIENNTISKAAYSCITLNDVTPTNNGVIEITGNALEILPSTISTNRSPKSGIYVENSFNYLIYNNTISSPGTYINNSPPANPPGPADTSVIGIRSLLSWGTDECNTMNDLGECMMFEGSCYPSTVFSNYFGNSYNGFVLESGGIIGQQGNATTPTGNEWQGPFTNYQTYTLNSYADQSPLYILSGIEEPTNNGTYNNFTGDAYTVNTSLFPPPTTSGATLNCPTSCSNCHSPIEDSLYQPLAGQIVLDSIPFSIYVQQSEYLAQQSVLTQLSIDSTLMNGSVPLQNFYTTSPSTNMGTINTVTQNIAQGNISAALSMNSTLVPANTIEQNHKTANGIMLSTMAVSYDSLSLTQYDSLLAIAQQCPLQGGRAVLQARAMLNRLLNTSLIFTDSCTGMSSPPSIAYRSHKKINNNIRIDSIRAQVYPNPANTMLNIEATLQNGQIAYFTLYNSTGEMVENVELESTLTTLPTNNLPAGMYYYRIINKEGSNLKADKQLIIH